MIHRKLKFVTLAGVLFGVSLAHSMELDWVASRYKKDKFLMQNLTYMANLHDQGKIGEHDEEAVSAILCSVPQDDGKKSYGKNLHVFSAIAIPALRHINEISKNKEPISIMEFGTGCGNFSWMVPFAIERHFRFCLNDIGETALRLCQNRIEYFCSTLNVPYPSDAIVMLPGDCRNLVSAYPYLVGQVDCICVFNVQHFFGPQSDQRLYRIINALLKPGGKAFLCALSFTFSKGDALYNLYFEQKRRRKLYPGFASFTVEMLSNGPFQRNLVFSNVSRPADSVDHSFETLERVEAQEKQGRWAVYRVKQQVTCNAFSPTTYRAAIEASQTALTVEDAFFIDNKGHRAEEWVEGQTRYTGAILVKRNEPPIEAR